MTAKAKRWTLAGVCAVTPVVATVAVWLWWPSKVEARLSRLDDEIESVEEDVHMVQAAGDRRDIEIGVVKEHVAAQTEVNKAIRREMTDLKAGQGKILDKLMEP